MSNNVLVKRVVVAGGFLLLCAVPRLSFGQSVPRGVAPAQRMRSASPQPNAAPPDLLEGLTLTDDQKAKIDQIRADTKSRVGAVTNDKQMGPEVADAMLQGYRRIENGKIFDVLTPDQQRDVRKRILAWRAAAREHQRQLQQAHAAGANPQPK